MTFSALVLAGSRGPDCPVAALGGVSHKALLPINGTPMVERTIAALTATAQIDKVTLVIEDPALVQDLPSLAPLLASGYLEIIDAKPSPAQSALHGFDSLGGASQRPVIMTTADNCLLTSEILGFFLDKLSAAADLTAATARTDMVKAAYPNARRTRMRFSDGGQGGCNLFALQTPNAAQVIRFWRQMEENRKKPLTMLRQLGPMTALRYLTNTLSLHQAVQKLGKQTKTRLATVDMPFAEAAIDVDSADDFDLAQQILTARSLAEQTV